MKTLKHITPTLAVHLRIAVCVSCMVAFGHAVVPGKVYGWPKKPGWAKKAQEAHKLVGTVAGKGPKIFTTVPSNGPKTKPSAGEHAAWLDRQRLEAQRRVQMETRRRAQQAAQARRQSAEAAARRTQQIQEAHRRAQQQAQKAQTVQAFTNLFSEVGKAISKNRSNSGQQWIKDRYNSGRDWTEDRYDSGQQWTKDRYNSGRDWTEDRYDSGQQWTKDRYNSGRDGAEDRYDNVQQWTKDRYNSGRDWTQQKIDNVPTSLPEARKQALELLPKSVREMPKNSGLPTSPADAYEQLRTLLPKGTGPSPKGFDVSTSLPEAHEQLRTLLPKGTGPSPKDFDVPSSLPQTRNQVVGLLPNGAGQLSKAAGREFDKQVIRPVVDGAKETGREFDKQAIRPVVDGAKETGRELDNQVIQPVVNTVKKAGSDTADELKRMDERWNDPERRDIPTRLGLVKKRKPIPVKISKAENRDALRKAGYNDEQVAILEQLIWGDGLEEKYLDEIRGFVKDEIRRRVEEIGIENLSDDMIDEIVNRAYRTGIEQWLEGHGFDVQGNPQLNEVIALKLQQGEVSGPDEADYSREGDRDYYDFGDVGRPGESGTTHEFGPEGIQGQGNTAHGPGEGSGGPGGPDEDDDDDSNPPGSSKTTSDTLVTAVKKRVRNEIIPKLNNTFAEAKKYLRNNMKVVRDAYKVLRDKGEDFVLKQFPRGIGPVIGKGTDTAIFIYRVSKKQNDLDSKHVLRESPNAKPLYDEINKLSKPFALDRYYNQGYIVFQSDGGRYYAVRNKNELPKNYRETWKRDSGGTRVIRTTPNPHYKPSGHRGYGQATIEVLADMVDDWSLTDKVGP